MVVGWFKVWFLDNWWFTLFCYVSRSVSELRRSSSSFLLNSLLASAFTWRLCVFWRVFV